MAKIGTIPTERARGRRLRTAAVAAPALIVLALIASAALARSPPPRTPEPVAAGTVRDIVDGDTVVLQSGVEIRLVGIQAPKLPLGRAGFRTWPLAEEAKDTLARLVRGQQVALKYGGRKVDRHGRLLAHLFTPDGKWVQGDMLRQGMARVYTFADNRSRAADLLAEERSARAAGRGIWRLDYYRILDPESAARHIGTFQLVEGTVINVAVVRGRAYLNFGADWRKDFTVTMSGKAIGRHWPDEASVLAYEGRRVRVRGWLSARNGPQIEATHPEQIEVLP